MSNKPNKETTVSAAEKKAAEAQKGDLKNLIVEEAMAITAGKTNSVQQMMAYCRQLKKK